MPDEFVDMVLTSIEHAPHALGYPSATCSRSDDNEDNGREHWLLPAVAAVGDDFVVFDALSALPHTLAEYVVDQLACR